jgi:hypothetical protein
MTSQPEVVYLPDVYPDYQAKKEPFKGSAYAGRNGMGYGSKIPTDWMIRINKRWHNSFYFRQCKSPISLSMNIVNHIKIFKKINSF